MHGTGRVKQVGLPREREREKREERDRQTDRQTDRQSSFVGDKKKFFCRLCTNILYIF